MPDQSCNRQAQNPISGHVDDEIQERTAFQTFPTMCLAFAQTDCLEFLNRTGRRPEKECVMNMFRGRPRKDLIMRHGALAPRALEGLNIAIIGGTDGIGRALALAALANRSSNR